MINDGKKGIVIYEMQRQLPLIIAIQKGCDKCDYHINNKPYDPLSTQDGIPF